MMTDCIRRSDAMAHPLANGRYDHVHAPEDFILGHESYKEWLELLPAADVVDRVQYDELLKAARAMHTWIFLHTADEEDIYSKCGLTDEINTLLGYCGKIEVRTKEADDD